MELLSAKRREAATDERGMSMAELMLAVTTAAIVMIPLLAWTMLVFNRTQEDSVGTKLTSRAMQERYLRPDVGRSSYGGDIDPLGTHRCPTLPEVHGADQVRTLLWLVNGDRNRLVTYSVAPRYKDGGVPFLDPDTQSRVFTLVRSECDWTPDPLAPDDPQGGSAGPNMVGDLTVLSEYLLPESHLAGDEPALAANVTSAKVTCAPREGYLEDKDACGQVSLWLNVEAGGATQRAVRRIDPPIDYDTSRRPQAVIRCEPACPANGIRPYTISFFGRYSFDPNNPLAEDDVFWDFGDGTTSTQLDPGPHTFTNLGNLDEKTFDVKLTISNPNTGFFATTRTQVTVRNARPVAVAAPAGPIIATRVDPVMFSAEGSLDPDADDAYQPACPLDAASEQPLCYHWDFGDGSEPSREMAPTNGHRYAHLGDYTAVLTVTDANGATHRVTIEVKVVNKPPVACFTTDQTSPPAPSPNPTACDNVPQKVPPAPTEIRTDTFPVTITFTAVTGDADGHVTSRLWKMETSDDPGVTTTLGAGPSITRTFGRGLHIIELEVVDNDGDVSSYMISVAVNQRPVALMTAQPIAPASPSCVFNNSWGTCEFDASESYDDDPTDDIVAYHWDFGDGTTLSGAPVIGDDGLPVLDASPIRVQHTWNEYGTYMVTLIVTDSLGSNSIPVQYRVKINEKPTAVIMSDTPPAFRKKPFQFRGSASVDDPTARMYDRNPDGAIVSYEWDFGDGTTSNEMDPIKEYLTLSPPSGYTVTLTVCDDDGLCDTTTKKIVVRNQAPVAVIGGFTNNTVQGLTGRFVGSGSYDPDGEIVEYSWNFGDGHTSSEADPTHEYESYGSKVLSLAVKDNDGEWSQLEVPIYVNPLPVARFTFNPPWTRTTQTTYHVNLDGGASSDEDGSVVEYRWSFFGGNSEIDGFSSANQTATVDYGEDGRDDRGRQFVQLIVVDNRGGESEPVTKEVVHINLVPQIHMTTSPSRLVLNSPGSVTFDASASFDPDGSISKWEWFFGSSTTPVNGTTVTRNFPSEGNHKVRLRLTDNHGDVSEDVRFVRVNKAPTGVRIGSPGFGQSGALAFNRNQTYTLQAFATDPDAEDNGGIPPLGPMTYRWNFGDGSPEIVGSGSAFQNPTHKWTTLGSFTVTLTVTDGDGKAAPSVTRTVNTQNVAPTSQFSINGNTARGAQNAPYTCNASGSRGAASCGDAQPTDAPNFLVTLDGSASSDPDGTVVDYKWSIDGQPPFASGVVANHTFTSYGTFKVTLTATDDGGTSVTRDKWIKINRRPIVAFSPVSQVVAASAPFEVQLDGSATTDTDGAPLTQFQWKVNGSNSNPAQVSRPYNFTTAGLHNVELTVTDSDGGVASLLKTGIVRVNHRPRAIVTAPAPSQFRIPGPDLTMAYSAAGSTDADGTIEEYLWDFGDGTTSDQVAGTHTYAEPGTYTVTLTVTDDSGVTNEVVVHPQTFWNQFEIIANAPPTAVLGPDVLDPKRGWPFRFDATGSTDDFPIPNDPWNYVWSFSGSPTVDASDPSRPLVTWDSLGPQTVQLQVRDDQNVLSTVVERTVDVTENVAPTAAFTTDPTPAVGHTNPFTVTFDGNASSDPDGSIAAWTWDFGDGSPTKSGAVVDHDYTTYGVFVVTLTVTDNSGEQHSVTGSVRHNRPPVIVMNSSPSPAVRNNPDCGESCFSFVFDVIGTSDPDGSVVDVSWDFGDGSPAGSGWVVSHEYDERGLFDVVVTVTDNEGGVATATLPAKVNRPPTAVATYSPSEDTPRLTPVSFDGRGSSDPDGTVVNWVWNFGDGSPTKSGAQVTHTYTTLGDFTVTLTVTDDNGLTGSTTRTVSTVNQAPQAHILTTPDPPVGDAGFSVSFDGTQSFDPDGSIVEYRWDFGDGSSPAYGHQPAPHQFPTTYGTYTVTLSVTDNNGRVGVTNVVVKVNSPPSVSIAPANPSRGVPFQFQSTISDIDGTIKQIHWDFDDGPGAIASVQNPWYTYQTIGTKTVQLRVTDNDDRSVMVSRTITVANRPPVAALSATSDIMNNPTRLNGARDLTITFDATGSSDPDNSLDANPGVVIYRYDWNFGDGTPVTSTFEPTVSHTYTAIGDYNPTVTVVDSDGGTASKSLSVKVQPNNAPTAKFTVSPPEGPSVFFDGRGSTDVDGRIVDWAWDFGDGKSASGPTVSNHYNPGTWTARLVVTDNTGATHEATRVMSIPGQLPPPQGVEYTAFGGGGIGGDGSISLRWNAVPGATHYTIHITKRSGNHPFCDPPDAGYTQKINAFSGGNPVTTYTRGVCTGGLPSLSYNVSVSAWNGTYQGPFSTPIVVP